MVVADAAPLAAGERPIPPFTSGHERRRREFRRFVETELRPHAGRWEAERWFPNEVFAQLAERGYLGLKYPREHGGEGGDHVLDAVLVEELSGCGSGGLAASLGAHIGIATPPIWKFGSDEQKRRWLKPAIRGEKIGALGITEPGAGSDVAAIRTRAQRVDGGFVVNGAKTFITNGVRADFVVTAVKTTDAGGHHGISFLVLERGMDGFSVASKLEKLGWHASDTAELAFDDVLVPEANLLGEENQGFKLIMANFQWERLLMALGAVGSTRLVLARALAALSACDGMGDVAHEASAGGERAARNGAAARWKPIAGAPAAIGSASAPRRLIAEIALEHERAQAITYHALRLFAQGDDAVREVTMAKLISQRGAYEAAERALALLSTLPGDHDEALSELDRAARDTRLGPIGGGTDEIMKEILGRQLGL